MDNQKILSPEDISKLPPNISTDMPLPSTEWVYLKLESIKTYDNISAYSEAHHRLDNISNLFTLFHHKQHILHKEQACIIQLCCRELSALVSPIVEPMKKVFDMRPDQAGQKLERLIANFTSRGDNFKTFNRIAELHGMCLQNDSATNQIVTLWTSIETITPSNLKTSKINNVVTGIMPFLLNSYTRRLIRQLTFDLLLWNRSTMRMIFSKQICSPESRAIEKVTALICLKENEEVRKLLYTELRDFHLLRFRVFKIAEIFTAPDKILELLETHRQKLEWQIRRIYRVRNQIVHTGRQPKYLHQLVENAHEYVDQVLFDILEFSCGAYRASSVPETFELAKIHHLKLVAQLKSIKEFDNISCLSLCPSREF